MTMQQPIERPLKLYLDTSVPNFLFAEDAEDKREITVKLFRSEIRSRYEFYISAVVIREIERAPFHKQMQLQKALEGIEILKLTKEADQLAEAYLQAAVFPKSSFEDAEHVAIATINNLDAIISWNFKHLVNLRRIKLVNSINEKMGFQHIEIISPEEVIHL
jgi:hypothetical protein